MPASDLTFDENGTPTVRGRFKLGLIPTPRHKLFAIPRFRITATPPTQFAWVPPKMNMEGNSTYGDCCTAEEFFAKAAYSVGCGIPEILGSEQEAISWARQYGFLNGAELTDVMDAAAQDGLSIAGQTYKTGPYKAVQWSDLPTLQAAIVQGPVKIAIDHTALPDDAGNASGWYALGNGQQYNYPDHCTSLCGFGPAEWLYEQIGVAMPPALAGKVGFLHYTWATIGFVDYPWVMEALQEAYVRNPTTVGESPVPAPTPTPTPGPSPTPDPAWAGTFSVAVDATNRLVSLTPPPGFEGQIIVEPPPYQP